MFLAILLLVFVVVGLITGDLMKWLAIALLIIAICFIPAVAAVIGPLLPATLAGIVGSGSWIVAGLAFAGAYMLDPDTVEGVLEDVGDAAEAVVEEVVDTGIAIVENSLSALGSSWILWGALGVGAFFLLSGDDEDGEYVNEYSEPTS
jgi:hypothetical protein